MGLQQWLQSQNDSFSLITWKISNKKQIFKRLGGWVFLIIVGYIYRDASLIFLVTA